jgi:glycosyltransferase involved in cell wall biosynthesis
MLGPVENLREAYARANVVINPMVIGTGLKTKSVEALSFGRPLVTTSCGAEGLEAGAGEAFLVADGAEEMARALALVLKNTEYASRLGRTAQAFAAQWNARQTEALRLLLASEIQSYV